MTRPDALKTIELIKQIKYKPSAWEQNFMEGLADHREILPLTVKQEACLIKIYRKSTGGGQYQPKERIYVRNV